MYEYYYQVLNLHVSEIPPQMQIFSFHQATSYLFLDDLPNDMGHLVAIALDQPALDLDPRLNGSLLSYFSFLRMLQIHFNYYQ